MGRQRAALLESAVRAATRQTESPMTPEAARAGAAADRLRLRLDLRAATGDSPEAAEDQALPRQTDSRRVQAATAQTESCLLRRGSCRGGDYK